MMTTPRVISLLVVFQPFNDDNASLSVGQSLRLSGQQTMGLRSTATINSFLSFRGLSQSVSRNCSLHFQGKQHARASKYKVTQLRNQFRMFPMLVGCFHSYLLQHPKSKSTQPWSETFWVTLYRGGVVGVAVARRVADDRVIALFSISPPME